MSVNMDRFHGRVPESNAGCDARGCESRDVRQCATCLEWRCIDHLCEHQVELLATRLLADCDSSIQEPRLMPAREVD
jgi:hypothetical protein